MTNLADLLPAGGGQNNTDFVADGAISSGAPVILTAAGKAAPVSGDATVIGSPTTVQQDVMGPIVVSEITGTNQTYVGFHNYNGGASKGTGYILTASNNVITPGAGADFTSVEPYYPSSCYDSVNNRIVQCWQEVGSPRFLKICVGSISGTTITWGTAINIRQWSSGGLMYYARIAFDPDSGNWCLAYRDVTNSDKLTAFCGTVQSGTLTADRGVSPTVINSSLSDFSNLCYDTTQNRFIFIYDETGTNFYARAATSTGSGTGASLTVGSAALISNEAIKVWPLVVHDSTAGKNVIGFIGSGNEVKTATATIDASTNAVTIGTVSTIAGALTPENSLGLAYDPTANKTLLVYRENPSPYYSYYVELTVSGSDITASSSTVLYSANSQYKGLAYNATEKEIVIVIGDATVYNKGFVFVFESSNLTSTNLLGIASGAISDTATGTINTWGSRNEVQTGLTIGSDYYVQAVDGRIEAGVTNIAYDISSPTYTQNFSVSSQSTDPVGLLFSPDGTSMYVVSGVYPPGAKNIFQYALTTAFDISTASLSKDFDASGEDSQARGIQFNLDGSKMFINGVTGDAYFQYSLSSAYDISTGSYDSVSFSLSSQDGNMEDVVFNADGTKFYGVGLNTYAIYQYSCSSAFDLSTASYDSVSFSISSQDNSPRDLFFKPDGSKMWLLGRQNNSIYQYSLSSAFDLSTASYDSISFSVNSEETSPGGLAFSANGEKFYVCGGTGDDVNQYATTANSFSTDHLIGKAITATQINIKDYTG